VCKTQDAGHLVLGLHIDDDFRNEAVKTGVGAVGQQTQGVGDDARDGDEGGHRVVKGAIFRIKHERLPVFDKEYC
jgi:hypothetical protein